jgi:hypothetical protein
MLFTRRVAQRAAADQRRRSSTVQIQGLAGAKTGHRPRQLAQRQPCFIIGSPVAHERDEMLSVTSERSTWMASGGDVGIKLRRAGGESLLVSAHRLTVTDEQWTSLEQISDRLDWKLVPAGNANLTAIDAHARPDCAPRARKRNERMRGAVDPELAEWRAGERLTRGGIRAPDIKAPDQRLRDTADGAPRRERGEAWKPVYLQRRGGEWMA